MGHADVRRGRGRRHRGATRRGRVARGPPRRQWRDRDPSDLGIARTSWLFGPPGRDFPHKILDAAAKARAEGEPLRVVGDEWGTPTYAADVADAIVELLGADALPGVHHLVNGGIATRATWAEDVLARLGVPVAVEPVPATTWARASDPPRWGVLAATPLPGGEPMRTWQSAMAEYAPILRRNRAAADAAAAATR